MTYEEFRRKGWQCHSNRRGKLPISRRVVQMLQGKWKLQILYELCIKCPMRFGELKVLNPITNTALTNALKMEVDELVQYPIYRNASASGVLLTEKGWTCCRFFMLSLSGGKKYIPQLQI